MVYGAEEMIQVPLLDTTTSLLKMQKEVDDILDNTVPNFPIGPAVLSGYVIQNPK